MRSKALKKKISNELKVDFYKDMLLGRRLEERINQLYFQQKFSGFCHLYIGQESVSTGVTNALRKGEDYVLTGYRDHVIPISLGLDPKHIVSELLGKKTGCSKGKGGSMHMFSKEFRFLGGHGIVGGQTPIACGVGFKIKASKEDLVCICFLGDAAVNQGQFHEALNMASIWKLPVIYVIENNLYGMGTAISRTCSLTDLADRAKGYNVKQACIEDASVLNIYSQMSEIVENVRKKPEPYLVEIKTYRYKGHSVSDPAHYRTKEEVESHKNSDCLSELEVHLIKNKILNEDKVEKLEEEIQDKIDEAVNFAESQDSLKIEELFDDVLIS
jgi:pyruvate dehydrogenase E1 component alpha subunit